MEKDMEREKFMIIILVKIFIMNVNILKVRDMENGKNIPMVNFYQNSSI